MLSSTVNAPTKQMTFVEGVSWNRGPKQGLPHPIISLTHYQRILASQMTVENAK
jgi:hypothetical protein